MNNSNEHQGSLLRNQIPEYINKITTQEHFYTQQFTQLQTHFLQQA